MTSRPTLGRFRCLRCETVVPPATSTGTTCPACGAGYPLEGGILALTPLRTDRDYPEPLVDLVASVETRHFWFSARNDAILSTLRKTIGPLSGSRVLDVGCGTGFVLAALEAAGVDSCGIDIHQRALMLARSRVRGCLFRSSATSLPFAPDFDIVTMFDVIEHVDDDVGLLEQATRALVPDGYVAVTVPAGPHLWTRYDEVIGHKRRYRREMLTDVLKRAGLDVRYVAYFSCLPLLAQVMQRSMTSESKDTPAAIDIVGAALRVPPEPLNSLFRFSVSAEAPLRRFSWLRGGSLIAVARRPA